jgi:2-polyprenyl-3-methyl-5-hydroxy-6-metoxy-1,4-benzoquinol methylase
MPSDQILSSLLAQGFRGSAKDFSRYVALIQALGFGSGARILDFGCSWGYGCWQLRNAGFNVVGFEVAVDRAAYAHEKLSVPVATRLAEIDDSFDVVFSAHVIEHVPAVQQTLEFCINKLRPGGIIVTITPNGSDAFRRRRSTQWKRLWGLKHPNFLDREFYQHFFAGRKYLLTSTISGLRSVSAWRRGRSPLIGDLSGWELIAMCEK